MIGFESYQVGAWYRDGLVTKPPSRQQTKKLVLRGNSWRSVVVGTFIAIGVGSIVQVPSGLTGATASFLSYRGQGSADASGTVATGPQTANLIRAIHSGSLLPPAELLPLLQAGAKLRHSEVADIDAWATRLANDVKDADD